MFIPERIKEKLVSLVYNTDDCIEYIKLNKDGYGMIQPVENGKKLHILVHRAIYQIFNNIDITSNDVICHKCDNPKCFNPKHLFKGTQQDNMNDKVNKGRQAKGTNNGRYIDGRTLAPRIKKIHTHGAKLTKEQVIKIKELIANKTKLKSIAILLNVSYNTVRDISCGRIYKNLNSCR